MRLAPSTDWLTRTVSGESGPSALQSDSTCGDLTRVTGTRVGDEKTSKTVNQTENNYLTTYV